MAIDDVEIKYLLSPGKTKLYIYKGNMARFIKRCYTGEQNISFVDTMRRGPLI